MDNSQLNIPYSGYNNKKQNVYFSKCIPISILIFCFLNFCIMISITSKFAPLMLESDRIFTDVKETVGYAKTSIHDLDGLLKDANTSIFQIDNMYKMVGNIQVILNHLNKTISDINI